MATSSRSGRLCTVLHLGPQPIAMGQAEEATQTQIGIRINRALTGDDIAYALRGHANLFGKAVFGDTQRS